MRQPLRGGTVYMVIILFLSIPTGSSSIAQPQWGLNMVSDELVALHPLQEAETKTAKGAPNQSVRGFTLSYEIMMPKKHGGFLKWRIPKLPWVSILEYLEWSNLSMIWRELLGVCWLDLSRKGSVNTSKPSALKMMRRIGTPWGMKRWALAVELHLIRGLLQPNMGIRDTMGGCIFPKSLGSSKTLSDFLAPFWKKSLKTYPLVICYIAILNITIFKRKIHISMAIFNSYLLFYQRVHIHHLADAPNLHPGKLT